MASPFVDVRHVAQNRNSIRGLPAIPTESRPSDHARDFWIPQVTEAGQVRARANPKLLRATLKPFQIYYANTVTGTLSRDLPRDSDDGDLVGLTALQSSSRSGPGDGLGFVPVNNTVDFPRDATNPLRIDSSVTERKTDSLSLSAPALQVSDTHQTLPFLPDPDMTASRPRANTDLASSNGHSNRVPGVLFDSLTAQLRHRSHSASDPSHLSLHQKNISSDRHASRLKESIRFSDVPDYQDPQTPSPRPSTVATLQPLTPPAPELVSELLERARHCIHSVILHLRQFGIPQVTSDEEIVDNLICAAITAIRDLLYVSGPSFRHFGGRRADRGASNASQTPLVPAQRRAVATLSKFVLSARAVLNDGPWIASDDVSQLSSDAEELERSVVEFVSIAQGVRSQGSVGPRRLHGYLTAPHADLAKAGAGTAGSWKGFGWVDIEDHEDPPQRNMSTATLNEFVNHISRVQERLSTLTEVVRATRPGKGAFTSPTHSLIDIVSFCSRGRDHFCSRALQAAFGACSLPWRHSHCQTR